MKRILVVFLVTLNFSCFGHKEVSENECYKEGVFSIDFNEMFNSVDSVNSIFELVLMDEKRRIPPILDAYGFKTNIKKQDECNYSFYLESGEIKALKYDLQLNDDSYQIRLDSSFNPYKNFNTYDLGSIEKRISEKKEAIKKGENPDFEEQFLKLFKASMSGESKALEMFIGMKDEIDFAFLSHDYLTMERVLRDHGYIKFKHSTASKPRVYSRKYYYE